MKKQVIAFTMMIMLFLASNIVKVDVYAEDADQDISIQELFTEEALVDYADLKTRGIYLVEGMSAINDAGGGKIGWGGITNAAIRCTVSTNAIVERKVNGSWVRVTSSTTTNTNALAAAVSKTTSVGSGYWYRCRCVHYAATDVTNSCTGSLWM